jgi:hypothetical protein
LTPIRNSGTNVSITSIAAHKVQEICNPLPSVQLLHPHAHHVSFLRQKDGNALVKTLRFYESPSQQIFSKLTTTKKALVTGGEKALVAVWGEEAELGWDKRERDLLFSDSSPILFPDSSFLFFALHILLSQRTERPREIEREG